jgi:hypothetical protein
VVLEEKERFGMRLRLLLAFLLLAPVAVFADSSALILTGVAGSPEHAEKFKKWTDGTSKALVEKFGFSADRVIVLSDKSTNQAEIKKTFANLKQQLKPLDSFFLFYIGHGSGDGDYKFNISGPDLTAAEYAQLLATLPAGRLVIVNGTSSSGAAIDALAGKNRIIVTATRSGQEANDTVFYDYFLEALQSPSADEDKDQKISVWEAFKYASAGVERFYKEEGRLVTEHAQISDNGGEKLGATAKDVPVMARTISFSVDRPQVSSNPRIQTLLNEKKEIEQKLEVLRVNKAAIAEADYEKSIEELLVQLALKNQQIKELEPKK